MLQRGWRFRPGADKPGRGRPVPVSGKAFTLAGCAAAPALFYAGIVAPFAESHPHLAAYFERLPERPSYARALAEARPYLKFFPYREAVPERFLA